MENNSLVEQIKLKIKHAVRVRGFKELREVSEDYHSADFAEALMAFEFNDLIKIFRALEQEQAADIFTYLDEDVREELVETFTVKDIRDLFDELESDELRDILDEMPSNVTKKIINASSKETRDDINKILNYDQDTVGSIMNTEYVELKSGWTVMQCIALLRKMKDEVEDVPELFVINNKRLLLGRVSTSTLIFETGDTVIDDVMEMNIKSVKTSDSKEEAADIATHYDEAVIPVVNKDNRMVGIVTYDDIIDIIEEEATEDIQLMAGIAPSTKTYFRTSAFSMFKSRIVWLCILLVSATLSQIVIDGMTHWGDDMAKVGTVMTALIVSMIPVIAGSAGNAGSQSSTMIIRALATDEVDRKEYLKVMRKEVSVALLVGGAMAILNMARSIIYYEIKEGGHMSSQELWLSVAASIAVVLAILLAKIVGCSLPMVAVKFKIDPAVMSAPILTTLVDALSTLMFMMVSIGILVAVF